MGIISFDDVIFMCFGTQSRPTVCNQIKHKHAKTFQVNFGVSKLTLVNFGMVALLTLKGISIH